MDIDILKNKILSHVYLDKGEVKLIDTLPRLVDDKKPFLDYRILEAARISYSKNKTKETTEKEDRNLISYLLRHAHTSPFEMVEFTFYLKIPIFVARQLVRHRTASMNEVSGRYSELPADFYNPEIDDLKKQSKANKQGTGDSYDDLTAAQLSNLMLATSGAAFDVYDTLLKDDVSREQARIVLPLSTYTEMVWKMDLRNLLHFLSLRLDKHAQSEMRELAQCIHALILPLFKYTLEEWEEVDSRRLAMLFTASELKGLKYLLHIRDFKLSEINAAKVREVFDSEREFVEFKEKLSELSRNEVDY